MVDTRIAALVLAAGSARRFGRQKLLEPYRGSILMNGALSAALAAPVEEVVLVTGADAQAVSSAARAIAIAQPGRLRIVHAVDHAEGLSASLRTGIAALPRETDAALVFLGDMPDVPPAIIPELLHALDRGHAAAAPLCDGQRGHPVALRSLLFPALLELGGDRGAGALLTTLSDGLALIPTGDRGVLRDVDHPQDLA